MSDGGKGSSRRPGKVSEDQWDLIFGKKPDKEPTPEIKEKSRDS